MTQLGEAIARYHKLIQTAPFGGFGWAEELQQQMIGLNLRQGIHPVCPFLRPNFLTRRQYTALSKAADLLNAAVNRILEMALADPALMARMGLLPGEKMLAGIDPGYPFLTVSSFQDSFVNGHGLRFVGHHWDTAPRVAFETGLSDLFYNCPPIKQFRRQYRLTKLGGSKELIASLMAAYKRFGGRRKPRVGILEFRASFQTTAAAECALIREMCQRHGLTAEVVFPEEIEYRNGVLRQGDFQIDLVWRRVRVHDFLIRFDLTHPLVRAYQDRAVCVVDSFRSELAHKRTVFCLLTDEAVTAKFPAAERKVIREHIPWTRLVMPGQVQYKGKTVDLLDFVVQNRENLVLMSNDGDADEHIFEGWETNPSTWEKVLKHAARTPVVVQERVEPTRELFPLYRYGEMVMRKLMVDVRPHAFLGKVQGCSTWLSEVTNGVFSSLAGPVPTYILEAGD